MNVQEIKDAIAAGKTVKWSSDLYDVKLSVNGSYNIVCSSNGSCIGLTWLDGATLNGEEKDFYISKRI